MPRRKAEVVKLFQSAYERRYGVPFVDTPFRKLARERNWCRYVLAGMEALTKVLRNFGVGEHHINAIRRAIQTARYAVDAVYYDRVEELERKHNRRK